jgi:FlaA1/EpsC-like NDP-sugar epimerase
MSTFTTCFAAPPVELGPQSIQSLIEGRVVLVTGASGSIGSEICRQVMRYRPARLVAVDENENGVFYLERELLALQSSAVVVPL